MMIDNCVGHVNEVTRRRVRLVLRWVTVCGHSALANSPSYPLRPMSSGSALRHNGNCRPGIAPPCVTDCGISTYTGSLAQEGEMNTSPTLG